MPASSSAKAAAKNYALRFISGKYQGGEFPLPRSGEIVIGRSSELDMVLVEDMVSRRHAKITIDDDHITVEDLGSTNGTFVNGEKISQALLSEGDRVLVGTSIIKLVVAEGEVRGRGRKRLEDVASARRNTSQVRTMSGSIREVPIVDLLQFFAASRKSGVLAVRTERTTGKIYLQNGLVVYASIQDLEMPALKSIFRILMWQDGTFDMEPAEEREFPETLEMSTEGLLMESMRQLDELARIQDTLPSLDSTLVLTMPMRPALSALSAVELDVIQLAHNYGEFQVVLDKSSKSDLDTSAAISKLIENGYIKAD